MSLKESLECRLREQLHNIGVKDSEYDISSTNYVYYHDVMLGYVVELKNLPQDKLVALINDIRHPLIESGHLPDREEGLLGERNLSIDNILVLTWSQHTLLYADVCRNFITARQTAMQRTEENRVVEVVCYRVRREDHFKRYNRLSEPEGT